MKNIEICREYARSNDLNKPIVYVLQLEDNRFYVGFCKSFHNLYNRLNTHQMGYGASWTHKYKPIELIDIITNGSFELENKTTLLYMVQYGVHNVRGGKFTSLTKDYNYLFKGLSCIY